MNQPVHSFDSERAARLAAEVRADSEHTARLAAEARIRDLEARVYYTDL